MKNLEELQKEKLGVGYIKAYPILKKLELSPIQIELLQLILSFTDNNQQFFMSYENIAMILSSTPNSISKNISIMKKNNFIITNHSTNYNGKDGGSSTSIKVSMDYIIKLLTEDKPNEVKSISDNNIPQKKDNVLEEIKLTKQKQDEYSIEIAYGEVVKLNENDYNLVMSDDKLEKKVRQSNNLQGVEYWLKLHKNKK